MSYCYARFWSGSRYNLQNFEGDFEFYGTTQNVYNYLSGLSSSNITWYINNNSPRQYSWDRFLDLLESNLNTLCGGGIPQTPFVMFTFGDLNEYRSYFLGKRFTFDLHLFVVSDLAIRFDFAFSDSNPQLNNVIPDCNISFLYDNVCSRVDNQTLSEQIQELKDAWSANYNSLIFNLVNNFTSSPWNGVDCVPHDYNPPVQCDDLRNSVDQQSLHLVVSDGLNNVTTTDITFNLSDGANQELALRTYMNDTIYNYFNNIYNQNQGVRARIMFNGGVCRSACTVRIVAKVYGQAVSVEPSLMPPYVTLDNDILAGNDVDILRATFEECNDKPVRIEEDLVPYLNGLKSQNFFSVGFSIYQVVPYKIVITGCEALTEWCCDDVTPIENDSIDYDGYEEPLVEAYGGGSGGGGSDVDISCICNGLTSLNQMLATKLDNLVDGQSVIADALSGIQVNVSTDDLVEAVDSVASAIEDKDFSCICDGLESINTTIDGKEFSVTNTVTPCQPIVTNPVNNITVEPCQPIVTNPVNNITVEPCQPTINVEPSSCDIDLSNLESILEDSLNHDNKSISAILNDSLNIVNPCDDGKSLSITEALFKVTDDGENCTVKSISEILDEKFLEPQIDIVLDNQLVGHIYKQNYDYRNY